MTADLALAADPGFLERSADPAEFVIQACERAKVWLREALEHGGIDQIVEVKSQAEAIRVYTMQKNLGKDAELSAQEVVRRAERGIGVAIRRGQEDGSIVKHGHRLREGLVDNESNPRPVTDFATYSELTGNSQQPGFYDLADGVPDEEFEEAVGEARAEENLSRANVARKVRSRAHARTSPGEWIPERGSTSTADAVQRRKLIRDWAQRGYSSRQMSELLGMRDDGVRKIARDAGIEIPADAVIGRTRRHDSNRIVRETVHALEGLAMGVQLVEPDDLDRDQTEAWTASLAQSIRTLNRLIKTMKEAVR